MVSRWLNNGRYYQLNLVGGDHRIRNTASLRICGSQPTPRLTSSPASSRRSLSAATFIAVLWTIGGALTISLGGTALTIPGFLVVAAVGDAALASTVMALIGRRSLRIRKAGTKPKLNIAMC